MLPVEADVEPAAQEPRELTVAGLSKPAQPWTLRLFAQGLRLTPQREGKPAIHNAEAGIDGVAFSPVFATLGVLLIAGAILARRRPHPALFLVDSAWFAVVAGTLVLRVIHGGSPLWLILVVMQVLLVWSGVSLFRDLSAKPPP